MKITVNPERTPGLMENLVFLWEASVRATHTFLTETDLVDLLPAVRNGIAGVGTLAIVRDGANPMAFMGIDEDKVEMLFVAPDYFGRGTGRALMTLATGQLGAVYVDVNEQNPSAAGFYRRMGFEVFERTELDGQGRPFPILKMKLKTIEKDALTRLSGPGVV